MALTFLPSAWRAAFWYAVVAVPWILFSDRVLLALVDDRHLLTLLQTGKGWFFVAVSCALVATLCIRDHRARDRAEAIRRETERAALREYQELIGLLATLEREVGTARDLTTVYRALRRFVQASAPCNGLIVSHYDAEQQLRIATYAFVEGREEDVSALPPMPMNDSAHARAVRSGEVVVVEDRLVGAHGRPTVDLGMDRDPRPARSCAAVPMIVEGRTIGAFEVQSVEVAAYTPEHVTALKMAANLAAIATQNVELLRREREAREEVEASEARFRSLIQNSNDIIRLVDRDGTFLYESPAVKRVLGYEPGELAKQGPFAGVHPEDVDQVKRAFAQALADGRGSATYRVRHAAGGWRWMESVGVNLLDDPNIGALVLNSRDVTDRKRGEEALRGATNFSDGIIDSLPGVFYVIDENNRYVKWNHNFQNVLGVAEEEMPHLLPSEIVRTDAGPDVDTKIEEAFRNGHASMEADLVTRDGRTIPYFFTGARFAANGKQFLAGIGLDRSEISAARSRIERLDEELSERLERLTALHEVDQAITGSMDLNLTLDVVLKQVTRRLKVDAARVLLYRKASRTLRFGAARGFRTDALRATNLRLGEGRAGRVALERERVLIRDPEELARVFEDAPCVSEEAFRAYLAVPLVAKGQLQGVLELFHRSDLQPDQDWLDFLGALASQTAIAVDGAALLENLKRSNDELRFAYDTTIQGWGRALDLKDEETSGHSQRVTDLTVLLGRHMGLGEPELVHVRRGALLHDIGKMGVPDSILLKPGKLTEEEWAVMKRHTTYAYQLLQPIPFLRPALDIPYAHHERWDGSGYPRGLAEEQIPLAARIFAVVDVFDALTSDRPYRQAWPRERVLAHLREQAGTHFDPAVVTAFLEVVEHDQLSVS